MNTPFTYTCIIVWVKSRLARSIRHWIQHSARRLLWSILHCYHLSVDLRTVPIRVQGWYAIMGSWELCPLRMGHTKTLSFELSWQILSLVTTIEFVIIRDITKWTNLRPYILWNFSDQRRDELATTTGRSINSYIQAPTTILCNLGFVVITDPSFITIQVRGGNPAKAN